MVNLFFKTKVLLIDDDELVMDTIKMAFPNHHFITCSNPKEALSILERNEAKLKTLLSTKQQNPAAFMKAYHKDHDVISVAFIDYSMPDMTGVELINKLGPSLIQKILLTGHADLNVAVSLFNQGLMQQFISKDEPSLLDRLEGSIVTFKEKFLQQFRHDNNDQGNLPVNQRLFEYLTQSVELDGCDSCLPVGSEGSYYIRKDDEGTLFLAVREEIQRKYAEFARDNDLEKELVAGLEEGAVTLAFFPEIEDLSVEVWEENVVPSEKISIEGKTFYISIIKNYNMAFNPQKALA